jgi:putative ABC transport system permease protein
VVRYARRHRLLAGLNVLSVALGVAVYLSIQIANHSANESFAASIDLVAGKAHLEVRGDVGENLWPWLARQPGVKAATAVVDQVVTLPDLPGEYLRIVGIDLFTSADFATYLIDEKRARLDLERWLGQSGAIAINADFATQHGWKIGDRVRAFVNSKAIELQIVGLIDTRDSPAAAQRRFAAMDIGWAQELLGKPGVLSSVQMLLSEPERAHQAIARLRPLLPPHLTVAPPRQRSMQMQAMLSAFRLNLTALSLVSLLVGAFLIYNTISASVTRRRVEIGILRSMGASRWEIRALFLGEAMIFGLVGIVLGCGAGLLLARVTIGAVEQTISALYLLVSIDRSFVDIGQVVTAILLGLTTVFAGAWIPASEAARVDPAETLSASPHLTVSSDREFVWHRLAVASLGVAVLFGWMALRFGPPVLAFAAAFFVMAGMAAFAPGFTRLASKVGAVFDLHALWRIALDRLRRSIHRNGITVAALATALAMTAGLTTMIYSFRETVDRWVAQSVVADLYIAPSANETTGLGAEIPPQPIEWLRSNPDVASVDTFREVRIPVEHADGRVHEALLAVVDGRYRGNLRLDQGDEETAMERVMAGDAILVTEPFARKAGVKTGESLILISPAGKVSLPIAGVYRDYTRDQGVILISQRSYGQYWPSSGPHSLAVYLREGADIATVTDRFLARFNGAGGFVAYSNRLLRERILMIFDQTFAVTRILRIIALIVAVLGIALSAMTLVAERQRETGVLRAIGASNGQVQSLVAVEAAMIAGIACILGTAGGVALAIVLTWVVNPAFFGWTIHFHIPWRYLLTTPLWLIPASLLAAWWPARDAIRSLIADTIRSE